MVFHRQICSLLNLPVMTRQKRSVEPLIVDEETELFFDTVSVAEPTIDATIIDLSQGKVIESPVSFIEDTDPLVSGGSDFESSLISLLKTILGAGLLAMPAAMASVGWIFGSIFIGTSAMLSLFGLILLSKCSERLGRGTTISSIAKVTYPPIAKLIDVALVLKCFGVAVSYLIVIGDMMPSIVIASDLQSEWLKSRNFWIVASMLLVGPLAFLENLDSLKYTSLAGLGAVIYMVFIAIWNWSAADTPLPGLEPVPVEKFSLAALKNFSIFIFAFTAHQNICTIQSEAAIPSSRFMKGVIDWSIGLSALAYFLFSIFCYFTYGKATMSNVFLNFPAFRIEMIVGRALYTLLSAFSYPLLTHPCRASLLNLLPLSDETKLCHFGTIHRIVTLSIVFATLVCSLLIRDLGAVSALIGTFIGIPICYMLPGIFYSKMTENEEGCHWTRRSSQAMIMFGIVAMAISIISLVQ